MGDELEFDFESTLPPEQPMDAAGHQALAYSTGPYGFRGGRLFRQTVCSYWVRGLCMKGEHCGFLHEWDEARMPICLTFKRSGHCDDGPGCPFKHSLDDMKECNMYRLGFCVHGPMCRYKHTPRPGPPPRPETLEAAKPRPYRSYEALRRWGLGLEGSAAPVPGAGAGAAPPARLTGPSPVLGASAPARLIPPPQRPPGSPPKPKEEPLQLTLGGSGQ